MINENNRWKGGRGYKKYCYDIRDIAELVGKKIQSVRNDVYTGKVNLNSLKSVFKYFKGE